MTTALQDLSDAEALDALRTACAAGDRSPATLLNLAIARDRAGEAAYARGMMQRIAELLPDWDEPKLRIAESWRRQGHAGEALNAYAEVLEMNPRREEALVARAALLIQRGDAESARPLLLRCVGISPDNAEAWDALGIVLNMAGDHRMAEAAFAEASRLAPGQLDYAFHCVEAALQSGRITEEVARLQAAADADPLNGVCLAALSLALERAGRRREATDLAEAAALLVPDEPKVITLAGVLLARDNRLREAEQMLRRAVALSPGDPALRNDRAAVLMRMHRHAEARAELMRIVEHDGPALNVLCNIATAEICLGLQEQGVATARRAVAADPGSVYAHRTLLNALPYRYGTTGAEMLAAARTLSGLLPHPPAPPFHLSPDPERRLRVGLLSGSLRTHPVGWLTIAGFEALDPARYAFVCLTEPIAPNDAIARRFHAIASEWHDISALDDDAAAALAREREIDLLIDLGGYGDSGRVTVCTRRAAPVQIKWVGMQNHSSGLPEMDWIITDRWQTPPGHEHLYSERLLRLADGYVCYSPPAHAPDTVPLPALRTGKMTFGCFNNLGKITPKTIETWAVILNRLPGSRLVLKTHQFSESEPCGRIRAEFAALGVAPERIDLRGSSRHRDFMEQYNDIDLVLDPFPYSGGLTTCEALWMGVPTVTLPGDTFSSRHSASHLSNAGLADWVASDLGGYIDLALAKAMDLAALSDLRAGLRSRVKASPLCDAPRFGASLDQALRFAWRDWCG